MLVCWKNTLSTVQPRISKSMFKDNPILLGKGMGASIFQRFRRKIAASFIVSSRPLTRSIFSMDFSWLRIQNLKILVEIGKTY